MASPFLSHLTCVGDSCLEPCGEEDSRHCVCSAENGEMAVATPRGQKFGISQHIPLTALYVAHRVFLFAPDNGPGVQGQKTCFPCSTESKNQRSSLTFPKSDSKTIIAQTRSEIKVFLYLSPFFS